MASMMPTSQEHTNTPYSSLPSPHRSWSEEQPPQKPPLPISLLPRSSTYGPLPSWSYGQNRDTGVPSPCPNPFENVNFPAALQPGVFNPGPSAAHSDIDLFFTATKKSPMLPPQYPSPNTYVHQFSNELPYPDVLRGRYHKTSNAGPLAFHQLNTEGHFDYSNVSPPPIPSSSIPTMPLPQPLPQRHIEDNHNDLQPAFRIVPSYAAPYISPLSPTNTATQYSPSPPPLPPPPVPPLPSSLLTGNISTIAPIPTSVLFAPPGTPIALKDVHDAEIRATKSHTFADPSLFVSRAPSVRGCLPDYVQSHLELESFSSAPPFPKANHGRSPSDLQLDEVLKLSLAEAEAKSPSVLNAEHMPGDDEDLRRAMQESLSAVSSPASVFQIDADKATAKRMFEEEQRRTAAEAARKKLEEQENERIAKALAEQEEADQRKKELEEEQERQRLEREAAIQHQRAEEAERQRLLELEEETKRIQEQEQKHLAEEREQLRLAQEAYEMEMKRRGEEERARERLLMEKARKVNMEQQQWEERRREEEKEKNAKLERERQDAELARKLAEEAQNAEAFQREQQRILEEQFEKERRQREMAEREREQQLMDKVKKVEREQQEREREWRREADEKRAKLEQERQDQEFAKRLQGDLEAQDFELKQQRQLEEQTEVERRRREEAEQGRERQLVDKVKKLEQEQRQNEKEGRREERRKKEEKRRKEEWRKEQDQRKTHLDQQKADEGFARTAWAKMDEADQAKEPLPAGTSATNNLPNSDTDEGVGSQLYQHYARRADGLSKAKSSYDLRSQAASSSSHAAVQPPLPNTRIRSPSSASAVQSPPFRSSSHQKVPTNAPELPPQYDVAIGVPRRSSSSTSSSRLHGQQANSQLPSHASKRPSTAQSYHSAPALPAQASSQHRPSLTHSLSESQTSQIASSSRLGRSHSIPTHGEQENPLHVERSSSLKEESARSAEHPATVAEEVCDDILRGVAYSFGVPAIPRKPPGASGLPYCPPFPEIITLEETGAQAPPLHIMATSWKHLIRVLAMQDRTRIEADLRSIATSKDSGRCLRVVVQFVKLPYTANVWHTIVHLTLDMPVPPHVVNGHKFTNGDTNVLPYSYSLLPPSSPHKRFIVPLPNASEVYVIPLSATSPFPNLPITLPNLALYLKSALRDSKARRVQNDPSNTMRRLARLIGSYYPEEEGNDLGEDGGSAASSSGRRMAERVGGLLMGVMRGRKVGDEPDVEDYSEIITPFRIDQYTVVP